MTDSRAHIIQDLQRWARQQEESGVHDVLFDAAAVQAAREAVFAKAIAEDGAPAATVAAAPEDPKAREAKAAQLAELDGQQVAVCTKCPLHKSRTHTVFGVGNPDADVVFVGEAPGRDEDLQGEPFVGRAGKLLTKIIEAMGYKRSDVYIANIVKCRPPNNRNPEPDEVATCKPFLIRQVEAIHPRVIVCLGSVATQNLLETDAKISGMRGKFTEWQGTPVMPTYHPAFLLRNSNMKKPVWEDMQKVMEHLKENE